MKSRFVNIMLLLLIGFVPVSAATFATKRLESIARCLTLPRIDTLKAGSVTTAYQYRGRQLCIRVNNYGEVSHIGFWLFPLDMHSVQPSPVYDFLERDLLERNLPTLNGELLHKLKGEHVSFVTGNERTVLSFLGNESFSEERVDLKRYRVTWSRDGRDVLRISFDMDFEMLSGCNSIEQEQLFVKNVQRYVPLVAGNEAVGSARKEHTFPTEGKAYVVQGDSFLIKEMRNDLYYECGQDGWHLTDSGESTSKVLSNMMLSSEFRGNPLLSVNVDKYGYVADSVTVFYQNLLLFCQEEGCKPYFGIKERKDDGTYTGTLMLVNNKGGYVHMLSVRVPAETLGNGGKGIIYGRLYVYIPMHNVSDRFFETNPNKK